VAGQRIFLQFYYVANVNVCPTGKWEHRNSSIQKSQAHGFGMTVSNIPGLYQLENKESSYALKVHSIT